MTSPRPTAATVAASLRLLASDREAEAVALDRLRPLELGSTSTAAAKGRAAAVSAQRAPHNPRSIRRPHDF